MQDLPTPGPVLTDETETLTENVFRRIQAAIVKGDIAPGSKISEPELARTYRELARLGPDYFYRGEFAKKTAGWMKKNAGLVTREDFSNYQVKLREPIVSTYKGYTLYGFPPPSSGVIHVTKILNIL